MNLAGLVDTELGHDISVPELRQGLATRRKKSLTPDAIGRAIRYALEQPDDVDVDEIAVRPIAADMCRKSHEASMTELTFVLIGDAASEALTLSD